VASLADPSSSSDSKWTKVPQTRPITDMDLLVSSLRPSRSNSGRGSHTEGTKRADTGGG